MKTATLMDLEDVMLAVENLKERMPKMKLTELIDVAARLKAVAKNCEAIDEECKEQVKKVRKGKEGEVLGETFKAILRIDDISRLDQKALKAGHPKIAEAYTTPTPTKVITFAPR